MTADDIGAAIVYLNCKAAGPDIAGAARKSAAAGSAVAGSPGLAGSFAVPSSLGHPGHRIEWSTFLAVRVDLQPVKGHVHRALYVY